MTSFEFTLPLMLLVLLLPLFFFLSIAGARKSGPGLPPGPRPLPIVGNLHMLGRLPHRSLAKLAQKYGPIMSLRLGHVPTVVASSAETAEIFLKQQDAIFASRPTLHVWDHMTYGGKDVALCPYGDYWRHVRKLVVSRLLSAAKVAGFEGLRRAEARAAMGRLKDAAEAREVVDVGERVGDLIEEIVFKMVIGKGKEKKQCKYDFRGTLEEVFALAGAFNLADFIPWLAPLDLQGLMHRIRCARKITDDIFDDIIEDHLKEEDFGNNRDIIGLLLSLMHNPMNELSSFGRDNVKALMFDMFIASIESTTDSVTWSLSVLLKHPRVMKLVQAEVDAIVGRDQMVKESDLSKLNYLDMVIKETLRLYPPGPLLVAYESTENIVVKGFEIPKKITHYYQYMGDWARPKCVVRKC